jgi:hypothetical protein
MDNRLIAIAAELGKLYEQRANLSFTRWSIGQDIERRKAEIIPADGWPGKNSEERKAAEARAQNADAKLAELDKSTWETEQGMFTVIGNIERLEAERRGLEWSIRGKLADAVHGKGDDTHKPDREFDTEIGEQAWERALEYAREHGPVAPDTDELPF